MINWREVDLGGAVAEGLENKCHYGRGVLVRGQLAGRAYGAIVTSDGSVSATVGSWSGHVSSVLQDDVGTLFLTGGSPPGDDAGDGVALWEAPDPDDPFVSGWEVEGDEDPCRLAVSASGRLYAYEYGGEHPTAGPRLLAGETPEGLMVAGGEIGLLVGGRLAPHADSSRPATPGLAAWAYYNGEWRDLAVAERPDAYTDAYTRWEPMLAGHLRGRPRVHSHTGTPVAVPEVDLDPARPQVCLAHVDGDVYGSAEPGWAGRLALAVQAVEGVQLWLQHSRGWTMLPGPPGHLGAARLGDNEKWVAWAVTDGRLWSADLSAVWDALD